MSPHTAEGLLLLKDVYELANDAFASLVRIPAMVGSQCGELSMVTVGHDH